MSSEPMPMPILTTLQLNIMQVVATFNIFVAVPAKEGDTDFEKRADKYRQSLQLIEYGLLEEVNDNPEISKQLKIVQDETGRNIVALSFTPLGEAMFGSEAVKRVSELPN